MLKFLNLINPNSVIAILTHEDREIIEKKGGVDGYYFDGHYYLVPLSAAQAFINAATDIIKSPDTQFFSRSTQSSAFVAMWNVNTIKAGYALVLHGTCGEDDMLLNPLGHPNFGAEKLGWSKLQEGIDLFSANDAHMTWPENTVSTQSDMDWREKTGELFHCLKEITLDAAAKRAVADPKPAAPRQ